MFNVAIYGGILAPGADIIANDGSLDGWSYAKYVSIMNWNTGLRGFTMTCDCTIINWWAKFTNV